MQALGRGNGTEGDGDEEGVADEENGREDVGRQRVEIEHAAGAVDDEKENVAQEADAAAAVKHKVVELELEVVRAEREEEGRLGLGMCRLLGLQKGIGE